MTEQFTPVKPAAIYGDGINSATERDMKQIAENLLTTLDRYHRNDARYVENHVQAFADCMRVSEEHHARADRMAREGKETLKDLALLQSINARMEARINLGFALTEYTRLYRTVMERRPA